jgi:hypothetical protein
MAIDIQKVIIEMLPDDDAYWRGYTASGLREYIENYLSSNYQLIPREEKPVEFHCDVCRGFCVDGLCPCHKPPKEEKPCEHEWGDTSDKTGYHGCKKCPVIEYNSKPTPSKALEELYIHQVGTDKYTTIDLARHLIETREAHNALVRYVKELEKKLNL